ncbi:hypothetical protein BO86DRAFT_435306 [Aspergillus japonicus CBS 114.51]|uniref:Uncharacterized protein n=1 Tax=Aspergillus japonicus CBS 114.51 TaxID=1448312 RepID=A0A8T8WVS7_ASPJA|nr:hypothetical protein BO86DRAFT_435306 [Aspergillus japonicus CBS 114.51]RAH79947.1 hypothetical protein BO86DRAFT_435306 [Aspergillus japonicus CBS 114.51]
MERALKLGMSRSYCKQKHEVAPASKFRGKIAFTLSVQAPGCLEDSKGTIVLLIDYEDRIESIKNFLKERWPRHFQVIDNQLNYDPKVTGSIMIPVHLIPLDRLGLGKDFDRECGLKNIAEVGKTAPRIPEDAITEQLRTAVSRYGVTWSAERITAELQASDVRRPEKSQGSQGQESGLDETPSLDNSEDSRDVAGLCSCLPWLARLWP